MKLKHPLIHICKLGTILPLALAITFLTHCKKKENNPAPKAAIENSDTKRASLDSDSDGVPDSTDCAPQDPELFQSFKYLSTDLDGDGYFAKQEGITCVGKDPLKRKAYLNYIINNDCNDNDNNLNFLVSAFVDNDNDGYGSAIKSPICMSSANLKLPTGYSRSSDDPNDDDNNVVPTDSDGDGISDLQDCAPNDPDYYTMKYVKLDTDGDKAPDHLISTASNPEKASPLELMCSGDLAPPGFVLLSQALKYEDCEPNNPQKSALKYYYKDADGDGYPGVEKGSYVALCHDPKNPPKNYISATKVLEMDSKAILYDCDDDDPKKFRQLWLKIDNDGDGYPSEDSLVCAGKDLELVKGYIKNPEAIDCDDNDKTKFLTYYLYIGSIDSDKDGFTSDHHLQSFCSDNKPPAITPSKGKDCDDNNNKLLGVTTAYIDNDKDGYGSVNETKKACLSLKDGTLQLAPGFASTPNDCDDNDSTKWTTAIYYTDNDNDMLRANTIQHRLCMPNPEDKTIQLSGYTILESSIDCNDNDSNDKVGNCTKNQ